MDISSLQQVIISTKKTLIFGQLFDISVTKDNFIKTDFYKKKQGGNANMLFSYPYAPHTLQIIYLTHYQ